MIKKKIMFGALAALFLSVGIFAATNLQDSKQVSDLTLANIEAMTNLGEKDWEFENGQPFSPGDGRCGNNGCSSIIILCQGGGSGCNELRCSTHR